MSKYPQDISEVETELEFQRLLIDELGTQISPKSVTVVAKRMSSSDALIKIHDLEGRVRYSLQRWGYSKAINDPNRCKWNPLDGGGFDPKQAIIDYKFAVHEERFLAEIVAVPFSFRRAS